MSQRRPARPRWKSTAVAVVAGFLAWPGAVLADDPAPSGEPDAPVEGAAPAEEAGAEAPKVLLEKSFSCEQAEGNAITHMPAVSFTPDGERLVAATSNGEIIRWRSADRELLARTRFAESEIEALAVSRDGTVLLALLPGGELRKIDPESGQTIASAKVTASVDDKPRAGKAPKAGLLEITPDGASVVVCRGTAIEVRRLSDLGLTRSVEGAHGTQVSGLSVGPKGERIATVGLDGVLKVWDLAKLEAEREVKRPGPLYAVSFAPSGQAVAFGGQQNIVWEIALASGDERVLAKDQPFWITTVGYSPDGEIIAIGDESCDIWLTEVETQKRLFHGKHHVECWLSEVAWAPDNETFLFGCRPNAHAGAPQIYEGNVAAEAWLSEDVQATVAQQKALQEELLAAYDSKQNEAIRERVRRITERQRDLGGAEVGSAEDLRMIEEQVVLGELAGSQLAQLGQVQVQLDALEVAANGTLSVGGGGFTVNAAQEQVILGLPAAEGAPTWAALMPMSEAIKSLELSEQTATTRSFHRAPVAAFLQGSAAARFGRALADLGRSAELDVLQKELAAARQELMAAPAVKEVVDRLRANEEAGRSAYEKSQKELREQFNVNCLKLKR